MSRAALRKIADVQPEDVPLYDVSPFSTITDNQQNRSACGSGTRGNRGRGRGGKRGGKVGSRRRVADAYVDDVRTDMDSAENEPRIEHLSATTPVRRLIPVEYSSNEMAAFQKWREQQERLRFSQEVSDDVNSPKSYHEMGKMKFENSTDSIPKNSSRVGNENLKRNTFGENLEGVGDDLYEDEAISSFFGAPRDDEPCSSNSHKKRILVLDHLNQAERKKDSTVSIIDKMEQCVKNHQIGELGGLVMEGFRTNSLADVQLAEFCESTVRPAVTPRDFYEELDACETNEWKKFQMGQFVVSKMKSARDKAWANTEATVNSLAINISKMKPIGSITKRTIMRQYVIEEKDGFPKFNLTHKYNKTSLKGRGAVSQLTHVYINFLNTMLKPAFKIWQYTYRPSSAYNFDKHFIEFPSHVIDTIFEISTEILGVYLPENLLVEYDDASMETDPFVMSLGENADKEISRRRNAQGSARSTSIGAMATAMKTLRTHHYDAIHDTISYCSSRSACQKHLSWDQVRYFQVNSGKTAEECASTSIEDIMKFCREQAMKRYNGSIGKNTGI